MSDIAVWTDGNERVVRKHYRPEDVNTNGAVSVTSENPSPPATEDYEEVTEFFNETDGFYYETNDPMDNSPLDNTQKQELYDAFTGNDISKAREIVENALQK